VAALTRFRMLALLAMLIVAPALAAVRVVDDTGAVVELASPATRIVTLAPHAAELVFAAGAGARIVGVIKGSDYPPAVRTRPVIGDVAALDVERIVALAPDLIVTWPWTTPRQVAALRQRGIAVFDADARSIDAIASDLERIGRLAGTFDIASAAARTFRARVAAVARERSSGLPMRVFYEVSDVPLFTLGGTHLVSQALALCGGENVFARLSIPAPQISTEAVLAADPQVIIAGTNDAKRPPWLDGWLRWPVLAAVRHRALYTVDANLLHRPGPRFADGIEALCRTLANARRVYASNALGEVQK
jgi:iron complex transport system substrate-binding protein